MESAKYMRLTKRKKIALVSLILCIFIPSYNFYLNDILQLNMGMGSISPILYVVLATIGVYSYTFIPKVDRKLIIIIGIVLAGLVFSYIIYPGIKEAFISKDFNPLTSVLLFLPLIGFPMMIYTNYLKNYYSIVLEKARFMSLALIILAITDYYLTVIIGGHFFDVNYMSFSYFMLPAVCISYSYGLINNKMLDIAVATIGLLVIFVAGARGCFICGLFFFLLSTFKRFSVSRKSLIILFIIIGFLLLIISQFFNTFADNVIMFTEEHGANSRTLLRITEGSFEESEGRDNIYRIMSTAIAENPFGYGLMGDRYILYRNANQGYAHSIIYEFLVDFGILGGPIFLLMLSLLLWRSFKRAKSNDSYYLLTLFVTVGLIKLFLSGSFLEEPFFWGLVGLFFYPKNSFSQNKILMGKQ